MEANKHYEDLIRLLRKALSSSANTDDEDAVTLKALLDLIHQNEGGIVNPPDPIGVLTIDDIEGLQKILYDLKVLGEDGKIKPELIPTPVADRPTPITDVSQATEEGKWYALANVDGMAKLYSMINGVVTLFGDFTSVTDLSNYLTKNSSDRSDR